MSAVEFGRRVLREEGDAIRALADSLGEPFERAVREILSASRVVATGIGKSGHIARKMAGTLSSTGTPAAFLHAAEAVHGDLGMVGRGDLALLYTHSGETDEVVRLFPSLREQGARTLLITGRPDSSAGRAADLVLDTGVRREACHVELAPSTSTTAMLALSDALALAVMRERGFGRDDFARFHPSGTLGKRLLLRVRDVLRPTSDIALAKPATPMMEVVRSMTEHAVGAACVVSEDRLVGIVTEGDLRRHLLAGGDLNAPAEGVMNSEFAITEPGILAYEAMETFQNHPRRIGEMPVMEDDRLRGLLVLKDLLRSGIV